MKKLMIAAAIVCAAAFAQAASANWNTGDTTFNGVGTQIKSSAGVAEYTGNAYLFFLTSDQYSSITQGDSASLWSKFTANGSSSTLDFGSTLGQATFKKTVAMEEGYGDFGNISVPEGNAYAAIIITHEDGSGKVDAYAAKAMYAVATSTALAGSSSAALGWGEKHTGTATVWTAAVPEPTSGLLLLIGMAGLALRRRRA